MMKKSHPRFNVPNFGAVGRKGVKERWRKQRGIDNKKRINVRHMGASPEIGYRNPEALRGLRPDNTRSVLVHNMKELQDAASNSEGIVATIAKAVSTRKRIEMTKFATQKNLRVTNGVYK
jgi:large subunit ribosomal protein L32e